MRVGDRVTVKNGVQVFDGVVVEDDVFLGPNCIFTNDLTPRAAIKKPSESLSPTLVQRGATIGANATIVCGITIGAHAFVGAGAVVTRTSLRTPSSWATRPGGSAGCAAAGSGSTPRFGASAVRSTARTRTAAWSRCRPERRTRHP